MINFEDAHIFKDSKKVNGNGVVLLDNHDYVNWKEQLCKDQTKFKILDKDPTITQMTTLEYYLGNLYNRGEISKREINQMRP